MIILERVKRMLEQGCYDAMDDLDTHYLSVAGIGSFQLWFQDDARAAMKIIWRDDLFRDRVNREWALDPDEETEMDFVSRVVDEWWATYSVEDKLCMTT